jgi:hypothetical protein
MAVNLNLCLQVSGVDKLICEKKINAGRMTHSFSANVIRLPTKLAATYNTNYLI